MAILLLAPFITYFLKYKYHYRLSFIYLITCVMNYALIIGAVWVTDIYLDVVL